jgi:hypothetical protein
LGVSLGDRLTTVIPTTKGVPKFVAKEFRQNQDQQLGRQRQ